jgi:hypothetical protein
MWAMTANEIGTDRTDDFVRVLDQFAALRAYTGPTSVMGGYRVLKPRRDLRQRAAWSLADFVKSTSSRLRFSGSLSVIFIGGLGLAVLAGPANCPCNLTESDTAPSLSRLGYVQTASLRPAPPLASRDEAINDAPIASQAELLAPDSIATGAPATAATETGSLRDVPALAADDIASMPRGPLPANITPLTDAGPREVKVASASPSEMDLLPVLPMIEVAGPTIATTEIEPVARTAAPDDDDEVRSGTVVKRYDAPRRQAARKRAVKRLYRKTDPTNPPESKRYPKWAKQMFDSNWQSQAFSYTR